MAKRNAFYAQSGGVTAVINATACGVIETARKHRTQIGKVYAGRNGIIGALREDRIFQRQQLIGMGTHHRLDTRPQMVDRPLGHEDAQSLGHGLGVRLQKQVRFCNWDPCDRVYAATQATPSGHRVCGCWVGSCSKSLPGRLGPL